MIEKPEGTRSRTGQLQRAKASVILLAAWSRAPMLPLVYFGHEAFAENFRHLRRTESRKAVGDSLLLKTEDSSPKKVVRLAMLNEVMGRLARLLPPANRGVFATEQPIPNKYLVPLPS